MWSCPVTELPPDTTTDDGSSRRSAMRSSSVRHGESAATASMPYSAPRAPTHRTSSAVRPPYCPWAKSRAVEVEAATRRPVSSFRCATVRANATPPPAPGRFVVLTAPGEISRSLKTRAMDRQVMSHPPPAFAGAIHSHPRVLSMGEHARKVAHTKRVAPPADRRTPVSIRSRAQSSPSASPSVGRFAPSSPGWPCSPVVAAGRPPARCAGSSGPASRRTPLEPVESGPGS